jgi:glycine betaine/choline ABC-type transport system substrate-binding protein
MRKRNTIIGAIVVVAMVLTTVLGLVGCGETTEQVTVGSKGFTEQLIIGEMMAQLLEDRLDDVDVDNNEIYQLVKDEDEANGIDWLDPIWNNNTYAFASWADFVAQYDLVTLSDLAALYRDTEGQIDTSITIEWDTRPDGKTAFEEHYDFTYDPEYLLVVEAGLTTQALQEEEVDVGMVFGTDSVMAELGWHVYQDDLSFFPPYDMTPSVRAEVADAHPEIVTILNELVATFPGGGESATPAIVGECQAVWQDLNHKVDFEGMFPDEVAHEYLVDQGLIEE